MAESDERVDRVKYQNTGVLPHYYLPLPLKAVRYPVVQLTAL